MERLTRSVPHARYNVGYGWTSEQADGPALRLGMHVPVPAAVLVQPDLYFEALRRALVRPFVRFRTNVRVVVYACVNDEETLRT